MVIPACVCGDKRTTCVCLPPTLLVTFLKLDCDESAPSGPCQEQVMLSGGSEPRPREGEESVPVLLLAEL